MKVVLMEVFIINKLDWALKNVKPKDSIRFDSEQGWDF